jgi:hypothetical protein
MSDNDIGMAVLQACIEFQIAISRLTEGMSDEDKAMVKVKAALHIGCFPLTSVEQSEWPRMKKFMLENLAERIDHFMGFAGTDNMTGH